MNRMVLAVAMIACAGFAQTEELTDEDKALCRAQVAIRPAKGCVAVVDCRSGFDLSRAGRFFFPKGDCMKIPYRFISAEDYAFDVRTAASKAKALNATAAIFIVNEPSLPLSLCAPESEWAVINYAAIAADGAPKAILDRRMDKMFSRATMQLLGGGSFMAFRNSAMHRVNSLSDLDALRGMSPAPEAMMSMSRYMQELGLVAECAVPYTIACQQGWAPAPTNRYQKIIWDHVHSIPDKPIKITYDKDKQKPVVK